MDLQMVGTIAAVGLAALYVARAAIRAWKAPGMGCATGCGKCSATRSDSASPRRVSLPQVAAR